MFFFGVIPYSRERLLGSIWDWGLEQPKTAIHLFCMGVWFQCWVYLIMCFLADDFHYSWSRARVCFSGMECASPLFSYEQLPLHFAIDEHIVLWCISTSVLWFRFWCNTVFIQYKNSNIVRSRYANSVLLCIFPFLSLSSSRDRHHPLAGIKYTKG